MICDTHKWWQKYRVCWPEERSKEKEWDRWILKGLSKWSSQKGFILRLSGKRWERKTKQQRDGKDAGALGNAQTSHKENDLLHVSTFSMCLRAKCPDLVHKHKWTPRKTNKPFQLIRPRVNVIVICWLLALTKTTEDLSMLHTHKVVKHPCLISECQLLKVGQKSCHYREGRGCMSL